MVDQFNYTPGRILPLRTSMYTFKLRFVLVVAALAMFVGVVVGQAYGVHHPTYQWVRRSSVPQTGPATVRSWCEVGGVRLFQSATGDITAFYGGKECQ